MHSARVRSISGLGVVMLVAVLLAACGPDAPSSGQTAPPAAASTAPAVSTTDSAATTTSSPAASPLTTSTPATVAATPVPPSTDAPTTLAPTTLAPTTTLPPGPPVFDPRAVGSNLGLPSFVVTITVDNTNGGQLAENDTVTSYTADPVSASRIATYSYSGGGDGDRSYVVGGRTFQETNTGDWYLFEAGSPAAPNPTERLDLREGTVSSVLTADFDAVVDVDGIPANHFVFDETDTANFSSYTPEHPSPEVDGEIFLAVDGNYVLRSHSKETSPGRIYEVDESLTAIGQVAEITLPADMAPMAQALDVGLALGALLPPGSTLSTLVRYKTGVGLDSYMYRGSVHTNDDLLAFFRTLSPTDGWSVTHIGHIQTHRQPVNCETGIECVIMNNGSEQITIAFKGGILLEYDHEHVFAPA